jgi:hypothetical protein
MMDVPTLVFFLTIVGGIVIGAYLGMKPKRAEQTAHKIPYAGAMMDVNSWKPKNRHEWNALASKVIVAAYAASAVFVPFMWVFVILLILYHIDWKPE